MKNQAPRYAILIAGNERRFVDQTREFATFLGQGRTEVRMIQAAYLDERQFAREIRAGIARAGRAPLLIVYSGHGDSSGWGFSVPGEYSYRSLCQALSQRKGGVTLIVNACCHAMSIAREVERWPQLATNGRLAIMGACNTDEVTTNDLVRDVLECWRAGKRFSPKVHHVTHIQFQLLPDEGAGEDEILTLPPLVPKITGESLWDLGEKRWGPEGYDPLFFPA